MSDTPALNAHELMELCRKECSEFRIRVQRNGFVIERFNWPDMEIRESLEDALTFFWLSLKGVQSHHGSSS